MSSRIVSFSPTTTLLKIVSLNARPSVTLRQVWSLAMSAVCDLLRTVYDTAYGNTHF